LLDINLSEAIDRILNRLRKGRRAISKGKPPVASTASSDLTEKTGSEPSEPNDSSQSNLQKTVSKTPEKIYLKAMPLKSIEDLDLIKQEVKSGNILIIRVSPLAKKSIDDVKRAVSELCDFIESLGGDIARLGEERIVITPSSVRIWREKTETAKAESTAA